MRARLLSNLLKTRTLLCQRFNIHKTSSITYSQLRQSVKFYSAISRKFGGDDNTKGNDEDNLTIPTNSKYKVFEDEDAEVVFDVSEEQERVAWEELNKENDSYNPYEGLNLERGVKGVIDIEDLVLILQRDNAKNLFVVTVPPEYSYVEYIVVVTGKSQRHMQALSTFVRKMYKLKRHKGDILPRIEGFDSKDWIALDLGNIALHIFSKTARPKYELETLWAVGFEHDEKSNEVTEVNIMEQYNAFLADFEPAEVEEAEDKNA